MLGSFYEKAWDLDRSAQEDPHPFIVLRSKDDPEDSHHKKRRSSVRKKMHLPNGDHSVRFGGISEKPIEKRTQGDSISKTLDEELPINGSTGQESFGSKSNEVNLSLPQDRALDEVLDTVLAAWTILIHRYQRDTFHQFTWGIKDAGEDGFERVPTIELSLPDHKTASSLRSKIECLRSRSILTDPTSTIFLNDGSEVEVCT
jgi:hypothetical protein